MDEKQVETRGIVTAPLVTLDSSPQSNFEVDGEDAAPSGWLFDLLSDLLGGPPHPDPEADDARQT